MSGAARALSSAWTFYIKFVIPPAIVGMLGLGMIRTPGLQVNWVSATVLAAGAVYVLSTLGGYKRVRLRGRSLLVSNYRTEVEVPLEDVERFVENRWVKGHPITVHLRKPCEFGNKFTFLPPTMFVWPWDAHPLLAELQHMIVPGES